MDNFEQLLAGGHFMDQHFVNAPLEQNVSMKIILRKYFSCVRLNFIWKWQVHLFTVY